MRTLLTRIEPWYVVSLLTIGLVLSYIDRYLPSLLIEQIKLGLALSDFEMGLILGPAFIVLFCLFGIPIGQLADRMSRRVLLAAGVAIWCLMTAAGAIAPNFISLFATRLGVGLGEATLSPCAMSLIGDFFKRSVRMRALNVFQAGTYLGAGLTYFLIGPLIKKIESLPPMALPGFGPLQTWQACFLLIGLPGLILAALMFTVREPPRERAVNLGGAAEQQSLRAAVAFMVTRWRVFAPLTIASSCNTTLGALMYWNVSLFDRKWGWDVGDVGFAVGIILLTAGPLGTFSAVWLTNYLLRTHPKEAGFRVLFIGLLFSVIFFAAYPLMPNSELALVGLFCSIVATLVATAAGPGSLIMIVPSQIMAQVSAIYFMFISLMGLLFGPPIVGWIADQLGDPQMLPVAMAMEAIGFGIPALAFTLYGIRGYRSAVTEIETALEQAKAAP